MEPAPDPELESGLARSGSRSLADAPKMTIAFQDLAVLVRVRTPGEPPRANASRAPAGQPASRSGRFCRVRYAEKALLSGVEGVIQPARLTAVMGASGAGKTTLLNALGGSEEGSKARVEGRVSVNGVPVSAAKMRQISGFVHQEDVILDTMTVREALNFTAMLKLPHEMPVTERRQRALEVAELLGLSKQLDTVVGDSMTKGISGGERRRLSLSLEMITNPSILFLDEPTSGLDTFTAYKVVRILSDVAHAAGRTLLCTIHQPSSDIFHQLDDLIVLAAGRAVYQGPAHRLVSYLTALGHPCPTYTNPADFLFVSVLNVVEPLEGAEEDEALAAQLRGGGGGRFHGGGISGISGASPPETLRSSLEQGGGAASSSSFNGGGGDSHGHIGGQWGSSRHSDIALQSVASSISNSNSTSGGSSRSSTPHNTSKLTVVGISAAAAGAGDAAPAAGTATHKAAAGKQEAPDGSKPPLPLSVMRRASLTAVRAELQQQRVAGLLDAWAASAEFQSLRAETAAAMMTPADLGTSGRGAAAGVAAAAASDTAAAAVGLPDSVVQRMAPLTTQLALLAARAMLNTFRNRILIRSKVLRSVLLALIIGLIYLRIDNDVASVQDRQASLFMAVMAGFMSSVLPLVTSFASEKAVVRHELSSNMYGLTAYFGSRFAADLPLRLLLPLVSTAIMYWMIGYQARPSNFFWFALTMVLMDNAGSAIGLFLAATFTDVKVAVAVIPLVLIPMLLFSGLLVNFASIRPYFIWISYISPMRYGYSAVAQTELRGLVITCPPDRTSRCPTGDDVLAALGLHDDVSVPANALILFAIGLAFTALAYLALALNVRRSRATRGGGGCW